MCRQGGCHSKVSEQRWPYLRHERYQGAVRPGVPCTCQYQALGCAPGLALQAEVAVGKADANQPAVPRIIHAHLVVVHRALARHRPVALDGAHVVVVLPVARVLNRQLVLGHLRGSWGRQQEALDKSPAAPCVALKSPPGALRCQFTPPSAFSWPRLAKPRLLVQQPGPVKRDTGCTTHHSSLVTATCASNRCFLLPVNLTARLPPATSQRLVLQASQGGSVKLCAIGILSGTCNTILATFLLARCQMFPVKHTHCLALCKHLCNAHR